jgi:hypothetical protein
MTALTSIPGLAEALKAIDAGSLDGQVNEDGSIRQTFPELPMDQELRVEVVDASLKTANSGSLGVRYTLEVVEPAEFKGGKIWDSVYFTGHAFQGARLALLLKAAGHGEDATDLEDAVTKVIGGRLVVALKPGNDPRYPETRWTNNDVGQKLRTGLSVFKSKSGPVGAGVTADVAGLIAQKAAVQPPQAAPQTPPQAPVTPPTAQVDPPAQSGISAAPAAVQPPVSIPGVGGGIKLPGT